MSDPSSFLKITVLLGIEGICSSTEFPALFSTSLRRAFQQSLGKFWKISTVIPQVFPLDPIMQPVLFAFFFTQLIIGWWNSIYTVVIVFACLCVLRSCLVYMDLSGDVHSFIIHHRYIILVKKKNVTVIHQINHKTKTWRLMDQIMSQSSNHRVEIEARADKQIGSEGVVVERVSRPHGVSSFIHGEPESVCEECIEKRIRRRQTTNYFNATRKTGGKFNLAVQPTTHPCLSVEKHERLHHPPAHAPRSRWPRGADGGD